MLVLNSFFSFFMPFLLFHAFYVKKNTKELVIVIYNNDQIANQFCTICTNTILLFLAKKQITKTEIFQISTNKQNTQRKSFQTLLKQLSILLTIQNYIFTNIHTYIYLHINTILDRYNRKINTVDAAMCCIKTNLKNITLIFPTFNMKE